jgi:UDP-N-acetylmuramoyl-tripeptide--D-alanyl-D-alanine ligase
MAISLRNTVAGLAQSALAFVWRRLMFRTSFVAITGSLGKTTTTRMLAATLASQFPINSMRGANNSRFGLTRSMLRTRFRHRYAVLEVGTKRPGALRRAAWLVNPDIVAILGIARTHLEYFPTLDHLAAEKAELTRRMGATGTLILNGEDPRVLGIGVGFKGRVRTFGLSDRFDIWASDISSRWPARLEFTVHAAGGVQRVRTQLVGEQWVPGALAAISVALECGMNLEQIAAGIAEAVPYLGRMQPAPVPSGAIFLRDDFSPSPDSWVAALRVMADASVRRKIVAVGDLDQPGVPAEVRLSTLGETSAKVMDEVVFFGEKSGIAGAAAIRAGMNPEMVHTFPSQREAGEFFRQNLRPGDLVLLRPSMTDKPERIYYAQFGDVGCTRFSCALTHLCDGCPELKPTLERAAELPEADRPRWRPDS